MARYLLDSSAVNRLCDEPDSELVLAALLENEVWVSALNVAEVGRTPDPGRRLALLRLLKHLGRDARPLEEPPLLLQRALRAYARHEPHVTMSVGSETSAAWGILNEPERLVEEPRRLLSEIQRAAETGFTADHAAGRAEIQNVIAGGALRPPNASAFIRRIMSDDSLIFDTIAPIYRGTTGEDLPRSELHALLRALPWLSSYLLAWAHSVYQRAVAEAGYGRRNAGITDLGFATYLPSVDRFVTHDKRQYRALRMVARLTAPRCSVLPYAAFRRRLL